MLGRGSSVDGNAVVRGYSEVMKVNEVLTEDLLFSKYFHKPFMVFHKKN